MMFALGVVLFALGIVLSVAFHEAGHMWTAKAFGMRVRRFYVGFGPKIFSFRRGETEYGLKALPLGGFCDIAGMTAMDELEPHEVERAMYRQKAWKRQVVMVGGIAMNFVLGFILIVVLAIGWGLPNLNPPPETTLGQMSCAANQRPDKTFEDCTGDGPAQQGGLRPGDVVTAVNGIKVETWSEFVVETQRAQGSIRYTVRRGGEQLEVSVTPQRVSRVVRSKDGEQTREVAAIGAASVRPAPPTQYGPLEAVPAALGFTGDMFIRTVKSMAQIPAKVGALVEAVSGGERDPDTPMSMYGVSVVGGQTAERGLWQMFVLLLASVNFFLGAFNLLPLLPLDGGHMAVTAYERVRNWVRARRGLPPGGPVDYLKLLPVTYAAVVLGGAYMLLTLAADIVNPVQLF